MLNDDHRHTMATRVLMYLNAFSPADCGVPAVLTVPMQSLL